MSVPQNSFERDQNSFSLPHSTLSHCPLHSEHFLPFEIICVTVRQRSVPIPRVEATEARGQVRWAHQCISMPGPLLSTKRTQQNIGNYLDRFSAFHNFSHVLMLCCVLSDVCVHVLHLSVLSWVLHRSLIGHVNGFLLSTSFSPYIVCSLLLSLLLLHQEQAKLG